MVTILAYDAAGGLRDDVAPEELPGMLTRPGLLVWVDLASPTREESGILSSVFAFHPLALEDCETRRLHPKIDAYDGYLFVLAHGVHPESSVREFRTRQLSLFVGANFLVSHHREKSRSVEHTLETARRNPRLLEGGAGWLLYGILDFQVDQYLAVMDHFQKKVDDIEEQCFTGATDLIMQEVFSLRKALMRLRRIAGHEREILVRLTRREFKEIDERNAINLRDVYDHLVRVTDLTDAYRELISGALEAHLSIVSNRTNEIMRALTVIATLFIPLTFIAGVYGMNFENQPEYGWRYGYEFAWALMVVVAGGMYWYFRRRGIFRGPAPWRPPRGPAAARPGGATEAEPSGDPARKEPIRGGARAARAAAEPRPPGDGQGGGRGGP
jgi:magnesium transporter